MASTHRSRIIVTPRGADLQLQLLREVPQPASEVPSPKLSLSPRHPKNSRSISINSKLPPYFFPVRPGYFGPKGPQFSTCPSPTQSSISKEQSLYPNYMKRDAKEYPPKHICVWKPKSIIQETTKMQQETPLGKYMHHTLYNDRSSPTVDLKESPKVDKLNSIVFGKAVPLTINLSSEVKNWKSLQKSAEMDLGKSTASLHATQTNFYSSKFGSTGFSKFSSLSQKDSEAKEERIFKKYIENEKNYQKLLVRFDEEAKRKFNRYQENQHEAPEFEKKMKEEHNNLNEMEAVKVHEDARFVERLKTLQKKKYEPFWTQHDGFFDKNRLLSNREGKSSVKKEEEVNVSTPFNSARERRNSRESMKLAKNESVSSKKLSLMEEAMEKKQSEAKARRKVENVIVKRKVECK